MESPVFIIGSERSGTNLLRLILNEHSAITVPHPPHIMKLFYPLEKFYGDLKNDRNYKRLIGDVCRMVTLHPYPWEIKPDKQEVFLKAGDRNLLNVYFEIYNQYLRFSGKKRWVCKSTFMIEHIGNILKYYPAARFIFLVRDGRDVAFSAKSSIFSNYHVFYSAKRWSREQQMGLFWMNKLSPGQILLVKYEDLISNTEFVVRNICSFLGEPFENAMLQYHNSSEAKKSGSLSISWKNTAQPVIATNKGKFLKNLSEKELLIFEAIAFEELEKLDYKLISPKEYLEQIHDNYQKPKLAYRLAEIFLFFKTGAIHLFKDKNSFLRLKKMCFMKYISIIRRYGMS